jgi:hypothetical protein
MLIEVDPALGEQLISIGVAERVELAEVTREIELNEIMMAAALGWTADRLRKRRERGQCAGLFRTVGRKRIIYSVPLTIAAFKGLSGKRTKRV